MTIDTQEALRLLDEMSRASAELRGADAYFAREKLRAMLSAKEGKSGLSIVRRPLLVSGMLASSREGLTILIDSESSPKEQTLALWHEVVHMVREAECAPQDEAAIERDACAIVRALQTGEDSGS
jgi:hypothetical protein